MNKVFSFLDSRIMCGGGRSASTRNKLYREEELLLISQNNSNFNSLNRDKNIGGANYLRVRLESKHNISPMKEVKAI